MNPNNPILIDRTGNLTVGVTDPASFTVYLSNSLYGDFLNEVLAHEIGHCILYSYGLLDDIHKAVKKRYWIFAEEWLCNFIVTYGKRIFEITEKELNERSFE